MAIQSASAAKTARPHALNSRTQDLFLLAKEHYTKSNVHGLRRSEMARRIVAFHGLFTIDSMPIQAAAEVVMADLWSIAGPQLTSFHQARDFIKRLGPDPLSAVAGAHPEGFYGQLIESLLGIVAITRVRDDAGNWTLPVDIPGPDPAIQSLIACQDVASFTYIRPAAEEEV